MTYIVLETLKAPLNSNQPCDFCDDEKLAYRIRIAVLIGLVSYYISRA